MGAGRVRPGAQTLCDLLTWTDGGDGTEAPTGTVHVRDLATGEETSLDPQPGDRCSQQSLGRIERYTVLGQHCGALAIQDDNVVPDPHRRFPTEPEPARYPPGGADHP